MGCCEFRDSNDYKYKDTPTLGSSKKQKTIKKVSFDIKPIELFGVSVQETNSFSWEIPEDQSDWEQYDTNGPLNIKYLEKNTLQVSITITFPIPVNYETILHLINSPKYRLQWDNQVSKMTIFIGNDLLDGKVSFNYKSAKNTEVYERIVRKYQEYFYIVYLQYNEKAKSSYTLFKFAEVGKVFQCFFDFQITSKIHDFIEGKKDWAENLINEVSLHCSCPSLQIVGPSNVI